MISDTEQGLRTFCEELAIKYREAYWRGTEDQPEEPVEETSEWMTDFLSRLVDFLIEKETLGTNEE